MSRKCSILSKLDVQKHTRIMASRLDNMAAPAAAVDLAALLDDLIGVAEHLHGVKRTVSLGHRTGNLPIEQYVFPGCRHASSRRPSLK